MELVDGGELVLFRWIRFEKALGDEFLALEGYGFVDFAEEVVLGGVEGVGVGSVFDVGDGGEVRGLVVLVVFFFDLARAFGLALDLLEGGEAVGGILCGFRWVVVGWAWVELAIRPNGPRGPSADEGVGEGAKEVRACGFVEVLELYVG